MGHVVQKVGVVFGVRRFRFVPYGIPIMGHAALMACMGIEVAILHVLPRP